MIKCPHCKESINEIKVFTDESKNKYEYLERFIDVVFALALSFAASQFVKHFQVTTFTFNLYSIGNTLLFLSATVILIYDWFAYHALMRLLPYRKEDYFARFIIDICILYIMYLLFISATTSVEYYLKIVTVLFTFIFFWHLTGYLQNLKTTPNEEELGIYSQGMCNSAITAFISFFMYLYLRMNDITLKNENIIAIIVALFIIGYCIIRFIQVAKKA